MTTRRTKGGSRPKEIRAWGIRRRQVDINQLALAYYLLARIRIEQQRQVANPTATGDDAASPAVGTERPSEAA
jgi:hypothetical protein